MFVRARLGIFWSRGSVSKLVAVGDRLRVRETGQTLCSSPTTRSAKKEPMHEASQAPLQAPVHFRLACLTGVMILRPPPHVKKFPPFHLLSSSNVPRSKNRNEAHAQSAFRGVSSRALGESPRTTIFAIALSATNRHRSRGFHHRLRHFPPLFTRSHSFASALRRL